MTELQRRIFVFWLNDEDPAGRRAKSVESFSSAGVPLVLIRRTDLAEWELRDAPFHPALQYLSFNHQSDYLRAYFMHHHGGGYSDLKPTKESWADAFQLLDDSPDLLGNGYREIGPRGVAADHRLDATLSVSPRDYLRYRKHRLVWRSLIGNGAFIFRPGTDFTSSWFHEVSTRMERILPLVRERPSTAPREGRKKGDGSTDRDGYPVPWAHLQGAVFAPLTYRFRRRIAQSVPMPSLKSYR